MPATSETRSWDAITTSTLEASMGTMRDNIIKGNPMLAYMESKGRILLLDGGLRIKADLMYGKNSTVKAQGAYDLLDTLPQEGITAAFFDWKTVNGTLVISRKERRQNSGKAAMFNLIDAKRQQLEMSFREEVSRQLILGDGSDVGDLEIEGLALAVEVAATSAYGGITPTGTSAWWKNGTEATAYSFAANGLDLIRPLRRVASRSDIFSATDLILCDGTLYDAFEAEHVLHLQFAVSGKQNKSMFDLGIENFTYKGATVMEDPQLDSTGYIYGLNTEFIKFAVDKESNFVILPAVTPSDQLATVAPMTLMANIATNNRRKQWVKSGGSA